MSGCLNGWPKTTSVLALDQVTRNVELLPIRADGAHPPVR